MIISTLHAALSVGESGFPALSLGCQWGTVAARGEGQSRLVAPPAEGQKSRFLQVPNLFHQARARAKNGCAGAAAGYQGAVSVR